MHTDRTATRTTTPAAGSSAATAVAHPNIALVKYWGKRDEQLILPRTGSLSMTLDIFPTTTTVRLDPDAASDTVVLNGVPATGEAHRRVTAFLDLVRAMSALGDHAVVESVNTVPTGAGLASSASGFAALALAAGTAYRLGLDPGELSRLARRGSGSASRSVFGGFAIWHPGGGTPQQADLTSHAEPLPAAGHLDPALVIAVINAGPKSISSRAAMHHTVQTSPLYEPWAHSSTADLAHMRDALRTGDLETIGRIAEHNALGMHATMLAARPAVRYLAPASLTALDTVQELRNSGIPAYATMDAGPNVKILCHRADARHIADAVTGALPGTTVHIARPGPAAHLHPDAP